MARRYDARTTTFSPEGRIYQVEYAMETINNASSTLGIVAKDGIVIAADRSTASKLLRLAEREKIYQVDNHVICSVAGLASDANILLHQARINAQRFKYMYNEPQPVEQLVVDLSDTKQGYTQFGGLRPFGVSFLFGGWDDQLGYQLYHTDPAGNYVGWKATAVGVHNQTANSMLKQDWDGELDVTGALKLAAKVLLKTCDQTSPPASRFEFSVVQKVPEDEKVVHKELAENEIKELLEAAKEATADNPSGN